MVKKKSTRTTVKDPWVRIGLRIRKSDQDMLKVIAESSEKKVAELIRHQIKEMTRPQA